MVIRMNKEKSLFIVQIVYLILLMALLFSIFLCILLHVNNVFYFVLLFLVVLVFGYFIQVILKKSIYEFRCPTCGKYKKMTFTETIFASRTTKGRKLKCKNCNKYYLMDRIK